MKTSGHIPKTLLRAAARYADAIERIDNDGDSGRLCHR